MMPRAYAGPSGVGIGTGVSTSGPVAATACELLAADGLSDATGAPHPASARAENSMTDETQDRTRNGMTNPRLDVHAPG